MDILTFHSVEEAEPYWVENLCQTPFDTPLWNRLWAKHSRAKPLILVAVNENRPLALWALKQEKKLGTTLRFLSHPIADYLRVLTPQNSSRESLTQLLKSIYEIPWDILELTHVWEKDPLLPIIQEFTSNWKAEPEEFCPYLLLPGTWEELMRRLKKKSRDKVKYYQRKAEEIGPVHLKVAETPEAVKEALEAHLRLHGMRWRRRGQPGVYWHPRVVEFHREFAPSAAERKMCRIYTLYISNRSVASLYGFAYRETFYFYTSGFDPRWKEVSPGFILVSMVIQDAIQRKEKCFDFLRGGEKYKYRWQPENRKNLRLWIYHPTLTSRVYLHKARLQWYLEKTSKKILQSMP